MTHRVIVFVLALALACPAALAAPTPAAPPAVGTPDVESDGIDELEDGDTAPRPVEEEPEAPCPECPPCDERPPCPDGSPLAPLPAADGDASCLAERLASAAAAPPLADAGLSVAVVRLADGALVYGLREAELAVPASTSKLVTAAAALHRLGPAYRFRTEVYADAVADGVVSGNLYVKGFGDPTLDAGALLALAAELRAQGLTRVAGDVVADGSAFGGPALPPGYETKKTDAAYRPATAALAVAGAVVRVAIRPGASVGAPCRVDLGLGAEYVTLANTCRTVAGKVSRATLETRGEADRTHAIVGGKLGVKAGRVVSVRRIEDPLLHAAFTVRDALRLAGIEVTGTARTGATPAKRPRLWQRLSAPLATVVLQMMKPSDNFIAEMLLATLGGEVGGWPTTWTKGQAAVAGWLAERDTARPAGATGPLFAKGLFAKGRYTFRNGSGLYPVNRLSALQLARVIVEAARAPASSAEFLASLPIAGRDGTLQRRLRGPQTVGRLRGKTGTLDGVDTLAGLVPGPDGTTYVFAFLVDGAKAPHHEIRTALDRLATILAAGCTSLDTPDPPR